MAYSGSASRRHAPSSYENRATDAAQEAVSDDMGAAMMNYMPLRGMASFGGDRNTVALVEDMLKKLNG